MGRRVEMFQILQKMKTNRLVKIFGEPGIGKTSLVAACCQYISDRIHIMDVEEILWVPSDQEVQKDDGIRNILGELFAFIQDDCSRSFLQNECNDLVRKAVELLKDKKTILIVDAKSFLENGMKILASFLHELLLKARNIKVIVILRHGKENAFCQRQWPCISYHVPI